MKKYFMIPALVAALTMFSCKENPYIDAPGDNSHNQDSLPVTADPDPTPDPVGIDIPAGTINVFEAVKIAKKLKSGEVSADSYYIKGWVTGFNRSASFAEDFPKYGNDFVYISAVNDGTSNKTFYAYRLLGKGGAKLPDMECIVEGDFIVINCKITNYNGVYESSGSCTTARSSNAHFNEVFPPFPGCPEPGAGEISVNRAIEISDSIGSGNTTSETYKIRGVVTSVSDVTLSSYGNITFNISSDGDHSAVCYRTMAQNGAKFTDLNQLLVGDTVLVNAKIQNYNGTCEPVQGFVSQSTNPNFNESFKPADTIYATCAEAKAAALALPNNNEPSADIYVIEGYVQSAGYNSAVSKGQQVFWIDDVVAGAKTFEAYYCNVPNGEAVPVGAKVRLIGPIMKYNTIAEMKNGDVEIIEAPAE